MGFYALTGPNRITAEDYYFRFTLELPVDFHHEDYELVGDAIDYNDLSGGRTVELSIYSTVCNAEQYRAAYADGYAKKHGYASPNL